MADALGLDVRGVEPRAPAGYRREMLDDGEYSAYLDEWGVRRRMPKDGFFFDPSSAPLAGEIDAGAPCSTSPGRTRAIPPGEPAWPRRRGG